MPSSFRSPLLLLHATLLMAGCSTDLTLDPGVFVGDPHGARSATAEDQPDGHGMKVVVDQSFTEPPGLGAAINEGFKFIAQTFVPGVSGQLVGVALEIVSSSSFPLRVTVQPVTAAGFPGGEVLGEARSDPNASLSEVIRFRRKARLVAGQRYAIVVDYFGAPPAGAGNGQGNWGGATGNAYSNGEMYMSVDGRTWLLAGPDFDVHFITYMRTSD